MTGIDFTVYKGSPSGKILMGSTYKDVRPDEVLLRITHAGLCGTDLHYKNQDMVLSHEGVGVVEKTGSKVAHFKVYVTIPRVSPVTKPTFLVYQRTDNWLGTRSGDRAGWGFLHDACLHCDQCFSGNEIFCPKRSIYGGANLDQGAFATHAVWKEAFLFHVPHGISSADAAPLMCAGATVFNALEMHGVRSTDRVGVVGIGGLGHLAIQFAAKMGCDVVVFSGTDSKRDEAMALGAKEFYATKGAKKLDIGRPVNYLMVTASASPDWNLYLPAIAPMGTIFPLTVTQGDFSIPHMSLASKGLRIQGGFCPSRALHVKMLRFAALHGIKPVIQKFPLTLEGVQEAIDKLEKGQIRYRGVLVAPGA
ncbi:NADP-dependent alcohol dehydrogenase [Pisolithus marmoratus]|nr:NADP-dependent alcohol dehydrogenase [Pisolithus marmoratus]